MNAPMREPAKDCPICGYTDCSLSHLYDRVIAPAINTGARVLSRVCLLTAAVIVIGLVMGWSW